jgi:hypothetical protein
VQDWFSKNINFKSVIVSTNLPPQSVVLSGTITEVNKGSGAERFWIGMGAGQARIQGAFEIKNPEGSSLFQFSARRTYLGGAGIGGAGILSMEELTSRLGETVAKSVAEWLNGQKLE